MCTSVATGRACVFRRYGEYARCNICANHSDGHGDNNCTDGEYVCECQHGPHLGGNVDPGCSNNSVGYENLTSHYGPEKCKGGHEQSWMCWRVNTVHKTGGSWYSTLATGECTGQTGQECTWRLVEVVKRVNKVQWPCV